MVLRDLFFYFVSFTYFFLWGYVVPRMPPLNLSIFCLEKGKLFILGNSFSDISHLLSKYLLPGPLIEHALWCSLLFKFWPCNVYYLHLLLSLDAVNMASTSYWNEIYSFLFGRWRRPFPSRMFVGKSRFWKLYQGTIILWNSTMHVRTPSMSTLSWSMFFFWPFICDFIKL